MNKKTIDQIKVLIADDMEFVLSTMDEILQEMGLLKSHIYKARTGREAIDLLVNTSGDGVYFDLILCDWNMPKLTGIKVLEKVRSSKTFAKIPFIMITTENEKANVVEALKLGVTDYIIKPFDVEKFKEKILKIFEINELDF